jgi:AcrR family transcriptional regulator
MERSSYHFGNLKETILEEALNQLKKSDLKDLSFRLIAKNIGVAPSAPYNHFKSKDHLLQEIILKGKYTLIEKMRVNKKKSELPSQQLALIGKAYLNFAIEQKQLFNLLFSEKK